MYFLTTFVVILLWQSGTDARECPDGWNKGWNNYCYGLNTTKATWPAAKDACVRQGGWLATVDKHDIDVPLWRDWINQPNASYWIGYNDVKEEGSFLWIGRAANFTYNNLPSGATNGFKDCVFVAKNADSASWRRGMWKEGDCHEKHSYLCEQ